MKRAAALMLLTTLAASLMAPAASPGATRQTKKLAQLEDLPNDQITSLWIWIDDDAKQFQWVNIEDFSARDKMQKCINRGQVYGDHHWSCQIFGSPPPDWIPSQ